MSDLFTDDQTTNNSSDKNTPAPPTPAGDTLSALVGEGKKYKTAEDLAKSRIEADRFIEQLKSEAAEMRARMEELEKAGTKQRTIEDVLNAVNEVRGEAGNQPSASAEDILKIIDERVSALDRQKIRSANAAVAEAELLKRFNNDAAKAKEFIRNEASRVGLTPSELKGLSETSPEAFKRILGLTSNTGSGGSPSFSSEKNSEAGNSGSGARNAAYYAELKQKLGKRFWDPAIQQARFKDRQALGAKFYE